VHNSTNIVLTSSSAPGMYEPNCTGPAGCLGAPIGTGTVMGHRVFGNIEAQQASLSMLRSQMHHLQLLKAVDSPLGKVTPCGTETPGGVCVLPDAWFPATPFAAAAANDARGASTR